MDADPTPRMPVLFVAHGAPMITEHASWVSELGMWATALPRPKAILVVSGHWEQRPLSLAATRTVPLVYDFRGFPERFYRVTYPAPGAPELGRRVVDLLGDASLPCANSDRGLDHGAYVPLLCMYPAADVPVLQVSMPCLEPAELLRLGRTLAPLRDEGVLIIGSGFLTHNMQVSRVGTPTWAREFDAWVADVLTRRDDDVLADFAAKAPAARLAHPTHEHFAPVFVAAGAAAGEPATFPITGFWDDSPFTRRSVQFG